MIKCTYLDLWRSGGRRDTAPYRECSLAYKALVKRPTKKDNPRGPKGRVGGSVTSASSTCLVTRPAAAKGLSAKGLLKHGKSVEEIRGDAAKTFGTRRLLRVTTDQKGEVKKGYRKLSGGKT